MDKRATERNLTCTYSIKLACEEENFPIGKGRSRCGAKAPIKGNKLASIRCHTCRLPFRKGFISGSISCRAVFPGHRVAVMMECLLRCPQVGFLCNSPLSNLQSVRRLGYLVRL